MNRYEIKDLAEKTSDSYSFDRYRSWVGVIKLLDKRGLTPREIEAVVRSKWMRWAADAKGRYADIPASAIIDFMDQPQSRASADDLAVLVAETFPSE